MMRFFRSYFVVIAIACLLMVYSSCKREQKIPGYTETASGLFYKLLAIGDGSKKPVKGNYLVLHLVYKTMNDSEFINTVYDTDMGKIVQQMMHPSFVGSFEEYFPEMNEGDSVSFIVNADSVFKHVIKAPLPLFLKQGSTIKVHAKLETILDEKGYEAMLAEYKQKLDDMDIEEQRKLSEYIHKTGITVPPIENGMYYIPLKEGDGASVESGKTVCINYSGSFLDGKIFDSNRGKLPFEFIMGDEDQVIKGLEIGIKYMREGGKARFIIPSQLAFGEKGSSTKVIHPYTTVVYDVELIKVK